MKTIRKGSSIVLVVFITAAIVIVVSSLLRTRTYQHDVALQRQSHEYYFWATQGLLYYGISLRKLYGFEWMQQQKIITISSWPDNNPYETSGKLIFTGTHDNQKIMAKLAHNNKVVCILSCNLTLIKTDLLDEKEQLVVSEWHQETIFQKAFF